MWRPRRIKHAEKFWPVKLKWMQSIYQSVRKVEVSQFQRFLLALNNKHGREVKKVKLWQVRLKWAVEGSAEDPQILNFQPLENSRERHFGTRWDTLRHFGAFWDTADKTQICDRDAAGLLPSPPTSISNTSNERSRIVYFWQKFGLGWIQTFGWATHQKEKSSLDLPKKFKQN